MSDSQSMISSFFKSFRDDGRIDINEFERIIDIAMQDGEIDDQELKTLKSIIYNLTSKDLTPALWQRVEALIDELQLDE